MVTKNHREQLRTDYNTTPKTVLIKCSQITSTQMQSALRTSSSIRFFSIWIQMQMTILAGICSYPTTSFDSTVVPPPLVSSFALPLLFVSVALLAPCTAPPPSSAAPKLPFFELLLPFYGSLQASLLALLFLSELVPANQTTM